MKCPVCGTPLTNICRGRIEYITCEEEDICPNGHYGAYFAYGSTECSFEDGKCFYSHYTDSPERDDAIEAAILKHGQKWKWKINPLIRPFRRARIWFENKFFRLTRR